MGSLAVPALTGASKLGGGGKGTPPPSPYAAPIQGIASESAATGRNLTGTGLPYVQQGADYYTKLLTGNVGQLREATTPERNQITDTYRGAERGLARSGLSGGGLDYAKADLARDRAAKLSSLVPGQRAAAAGSLVNTGTGLVSAGTSATGAALGGYSALLGGSNDAARLAESKRQFDEGESGKLGEGLAPMLVDLLSKSGKKGAPAAKSVGFTLR